MTLTQAQHEAAQARGPKILVSACAGSGKTRILVERIRHLDTRATTAVITFTIDAAQELKTRLKKEGLTVEFCGTLHSFMLALMKPFNRAMTVATEPITEALLQESVLEQGYNGSLKAVKELLKNGASPNAPCRVATKPPTIQSLVARSYCMKLTDANLIDYDGILWAGERLLSQFKAAPSLDDGPDSLTDLIVDEFQDSSDQDARLYERLHQLGVRLFVVGDEMQSIFSFRGGNVGHIQNWTGTVHRMSENFRSAQPICDLANLLSTPLQCESKSGDGGRVLFQRYTDSTIEAADVCRKIDESIYLSTCSTAVLLRTNNLVDAYAFALRSLGVHVQTRQEPSRPPDWPLCLALLNCMANPDNDRLCAMFLSRSRGPKLANEIALSALEQRKTMNEISLRLPDLSEPDPLGTVPEMIIPTLARCLISHESQWIVRRALTDGIGSVQDLIMALEQHRDEDQGEGVAVLTIHGAKGREWDTVFLPHLVQGTLPSSRSKTPEQIAEDRRLMYVAVTRAKRVLHLSYHDRTIGQYGTKDASPSMFLKEMKLV